MKLQKIASGVIGIIICVFVVAFIFIEPFYNEVIYFYHYHKGNYSDVEKNAMKSTRSSEPLNYTFETDAKTYVFPLPNGATEWPNGGWIVINYEFWNEYYNKIKEPEALGDFICVDQLGACIIFISNDDQVKLELYIGNIARRYERLQIYIYEDIYPYN